MAWAPSLCALPACAARPWPPAVIPPVPLRRVMMASPLRPASKTSAALDPLIDAARTPCPSGEPTSSSLTMTTRMGTTASSPPVAASAFSASGMTTRPPFMSSTPGPRARSPSRRKPSKLPGGNTVSRCPTSATAPLLGSCARVRKTRWSANRSLGRTFTSTPSTAKSARSRVPTLRPPSGFSVYEFWSTRGAMASSMARCLSESQAVASSAWELIEGGERTIPCLDEPRTDPHSGDSTLGGRMGILQSGVYDHSHITGLAKAPNANTRFASTGPRLEAEWLDEAYRRARDLDTSPMTAAGVRLVWWRGDELGWHDLVAHPHAYAVIGRHTKCDVVLPSDPAVALRHLLLRATTLDDGSPALRVLDLRTGLGFHLDDDTERRALVATGPLALRVGRYALVAIPSRAELPET